MEFSSRPRRRIGVLLIIPIPCACRSLTLAWIIDSYDLCHRWLFIALVVLIFGCNCPVRITPLIVCYLSLHVPQTLPFVLPPYLSKFATDYLILTWVSTVSFYAMVPRSQCTIHVVKQFGLFIHIFYFSSLMSVQFITGLCPCGKATWEDVGISPALLCGSFSACLWQVAVSV